MVDTAHDVPVASNPPEVDFRALYDAHPDYVARRRDGSYEQAQIDLEVALFKLPNLLRVLPAAEPVESVLEIGCATGELIAAMPIAPGGRRVGIDISEANVAGRAGSLSGRRVSLRRLPRAGRFALRCRGPERRARARPGRCGVPARCRRAGRDRAAQPAAGGQLAEPAPAVRSGRCLRPPPSLFARRRRGAGRARRTRRAGAGACLGPRDRRGAGLAKPSPEALRRRVRRVEAEPLLRRAVHAAAVGVPPFGRRLFASNLFIAARARGHPGPSPRQVR